MVIAVIIYSKIPEVLACSDSDSVPRLSSPRPNVAGRFDSSTETSVLSSIILIAPLKAIICFILDISDLEEIHYGNILVYLHDLL